MNLYDKITALYPELTIEDFLTVITLQNDSDGKGDYIKEWNHPTLAKPTDEQLGIVPTETPTEVVETPVEPTQEA